MKIKLNEQGTLMWTNSKGRLHRAGDGPAMIYADGSMSWYTHGRVHRAHHSPAITTADGAKRWLIDDELYNRPPGGPCSVWPIGYGTPPRRGRWCYENLEWALPERTGSSGRIEWWPRVPLTKR